MAISVEGNSIEFRFPEVDPAAELEVSFQRTLRVPDDGSQYGLPPGFGGFPLRRVADLATGRLPAQWLRSGGVVMPMWQSEACWLSFSVNADYPFLVKIGCGGINAVTGGPWSPIPDFETEDYFEVPNQPWLDGFCVGKGEVRQFVAMPLGQDYTVEEQITGRAEQGGIQISVVPLKAAVYQQRPRIIECFDDATLGFVLPCAAVGEMGLAAGGSITQSIETPVEPRENWELDSESRLSVHIANSAEWLSITDEQPPSLPLSAADYTRMGMPWFEWYDDSFARAGSQILDRAKSVADIGKERGEQSLPENESFEPPEPVLLGRSPSEAAP